MSHSDISDCRFPALSVRIRNEFMKVSLLLNYLVWKSLIPVRS